MVPDSTEPSGSHRPAEEVFAEYVARLDAGEELEFEEFCVEHAEIEGSLRELNRRWAEVREALGATVGEKDVSTGEAHGTSKGEQLWNLFPRFTDVYFSDVTVDALHETLASLGAERQRRGPSTSDSPTAP